MIIRHKLMLIWAPLALCLVPILHGCTITATTGNTDTIASPGVASTGFAPDKVPSTAELTKLTKETLLAWNEAIQAKDFTKFHTTTSKFFQKNITVERLAASFKSITDENENFNIESIVNEREPIFTPAPAINSDGVLVLQGYYPSTPARTSFILKYIPEADAWKLLGIDVSFAKVPAGDAEEAPAEEAPAEEAPAEEAPAKDTP
ncbi:hypothetical protein [Microcoleus sp. Pol10D4]|uniref:hypothetical protein n=1 Tax=Microcoleus sp. Pol10D4 TaxID=3055387 RepID=UPI002FD22AF2